MPAGVSTPRQHVDADLKQPLMQDRDSNIDEDDEKKVVVGTADDRFHSYMCGVMPVLQTPLFERMLFRVSRGNTYVRFANVEHDMYDAASGENVKKAVFYVVYVGQQVGKRIEKMCDYFRASRYQIPSQPQQYEYERNLISVQTKEKQQVLDRTQEAILNLLRRIAWDGPHKQMSPLRNWQEAIRRERLICEALKKCSCPNNSNIITCEGWVPLEDLPNLENCIKSAAHFSGSLPVVMQPLMVKQAPPTYFKVNKFTGSFQGIVDTYGVPRYQEVNPGLFTIATFPFLFGVMYGDIGHGVLLTIFALLLVLNENKLAAAAKNRTLNELVGMAFGGRYVILCMGICAVYCGIIYNDCFSIPTNLYGSQWSFDPNCFNCVANCTTCPALGFPSSVYPIGLDPGWYHTKNELTFFNSLKMKLAVIIGVIQMEFGIILSLFNHFYFKSTLSIWFEFIPQIIFMTSTFGYMCFLIIYKWCVDWVGTGQNPPNLIQTMINMFLSPGSVASNEQLYPGQAGVQVVLVLLAVFSVPMMLLPKPILERRRHMQRQMHLSQVHPSGAHFSQEDEKDHEGDVEAQKHLHETGHTQAGASGHGHGHGDDEEEFDSSEHFIHQAIHTIEFVLGAVSNTASYLRLWALSLAHAELANVFWGKMIQQYGISTGSWYMTVVGFAVWAAATFAVLLCMDVLECFLHALRLHWVEFQNKFFQADGYAFQPFDFKFVEE